MNKRDNIIKWAIISVFVGLYALVSIISTIHVIDFFELSNDTWLAVTLAIAFEIGAAASLAAIVILDRTNRFLVWLLFLAITSMQMMGNMYFAYVHLDDYQAWSELFGLIEEEPIFQKRVLSLVSGAILPLVALGFIKSLVDYIRPSKKIEDKVSEPISEESDLTNSDQVEVELTEKDAEVMFEALENPPEPNEKLKDATKKHTERKIAKVIAKDPELKKRIEEEIKKEEEITRVQKLEDTDSPTKLPGDVTFRRGAI
jgi:TusA-related sulfurtransferase